MTTKYEEYLICQRRGHQSNGTHEGHEYASWTYCKWCGTRYWNTTKVTLHEENIPQKSGKKDTVIHIPNDTPEATQDAIDASLPGDELIFDAGRYVFHKTLVMQPDRTYHIVNQTLVRALPFEEDGLIECPDPVKLNQNGNRFDANILEIEHGLSQEQEKQA